MPSTTGFASDKTSLRIHGLAAIALISALTFTAPIARAADPLPSWNDGPAKQSIVAFVTKVTTAGSPDFLPAPERIATFDNDGTLWCEQPLPVQFYFAVDRVKALAPQHPEWKSQEPFASILKGDVGAALAGGEKPLVDLLMSTHAGMSADEFSGIVKDWIATAKNPSTGRRFLDMTYPPMLELLDYLRANGFKTFIVSGGGIEFMRPWAEAAYGIPPEQVIGSSVKTRFELEGGKPVLVRLPEVNFNDDKGGKAVGIYEHIGRRPIAAFGNSDGDQQMLEYTQGGPGARFELLVLHDDAAREFAYGPARGLPDAKLGAFTPALDEHAKRDGWTVVSMKNDWKVVVGTGAADITAIDILLEPDQTMIEHASAANARLLAAYPAGFALDAAHRPHVTLFQGFVRTADLEQVYAAVGKVVAAAHVDQMKLEASKSYYAPTGATGVAGIVVRTTPQLLQLQASIIAAVKPYRLESGTIAGFTAPHDDPAMDKAFVDYAATYDPKASGAHFNPHVTTGVAQKDFLDKMVAEPFKPFTFSPVRAAVFQIGPYGTAARMLKEWDPK